MSTSQNPSGNRIPVESQNPDGSQNPSGSKDLGDRQIAENLRIQNLEDRLVSFSKRRAGIYKSASEISILCGVQIGIIILSPSEKVFTYGSPNIEAVVDRFWGRDTLRVVDLAVSAHEAEHNPYVMQTNNKHNELSARLDTLKKVTARIAEIANLIYSNFWWETPLEYLKPDEIEKLAFSMETLRDTAKEIGETLKKIEASANADVAGSSSNQ